MAAKRFSPSAAWDDVRVTLVAHRQLLIALAGAFFLLPLLALSLFGPGNVFLTVGENPTGAQLWAVFQPLLPWLLMFLIFQMAGQLAILAAILRTGAVTVGDAVRVGLSRLGYLILANLLFLVLSMAAMILVAVLFGLLAVIAGPIGGALAVLGAIAAIGVYIWLFVRFVLLPVLLIAEDVRSPLALLGRSWRATSGHGFTIFAFYIIVTIVFLIIAITISILFGPLLALLGLEMAPGGAGAAILAVINGIVSSVGTVVFLLMQLAIYRQVAGTAGPTVRPFR